MAELDLQQQLVEAAKERSDIAKALLAIQSSLDKMEPMVSRMEHVLASVAPAINAGVHKAVEQPTEIAHDTAPASTPTAISAASTPIVASVPAATASASSATNSLILPATGGCFPRAHTTCSTTGLDPDTGHIHFAEVPLFVMDKFLTGPAHGELSYFGLPPSVGILSAVRPLEEAVHTPFRPPDLWNSRGRPPGPAPVPKPPWLLLGTTHMFEEIPGTIVMAKRQSQDIAMGEFIQPIFSHGNAWELQHVSWSSFLLYQTEAQQTGVLYCRRHEQVKHGREHCSFQVLRSPWPPPRQEGLQNPLTESACSLKGIPIAVLIVTCSSEVMAKYHITCSHVGVLWGYLCRELQSKEILVKRAYWHLIAEVRLEALKFSWLPPQVVLYCSGASASLYGSGYFTCGVALPIQAPILYPSGLVELQIAWLLVVQHSDGGKMFQQPLYAASALDGSHHFPWVIAWLSGDFLSCSSLVDDQFRSVLFVPVFRLGISLQMHATGLVQHVSPGSVLHLFWNEAAPSSVITIFLDGGHQLEDKSLQPMLALSNFSLNHASPSVVYLDPDGPLLHCTPTAQTGHDIHLVVERMNLLLPPLRKGIEHQPWPPPTQVQRMNLLLPVTTLVPVPEFVMREDTKATSISPDASVFVYPNAKLDASVFVCPNAKLDAAYKLFDEKPLHADGDLVASLQLDTGQPIISTATGPRQVTNHDLGAELRPRPWPSFECSHVCTLLQPEECRSLAKVASAGIPRQQSVGFLPGDELALGSPVRLQSVGSREFLQYELLQPWPLPHQENVRHGAIQEDKLLELMVALVGLKPWLPWKCFSLEENFSWPNFVTRALCDTSPWDPGDSKIRMWNIMMISHCVTRYKFLALSWDPGQQANNCHKCRASIASAAVMCARYILDNCLKHLSVQSTKPSWSICYGILQSEHLWEVIIVLMELCNAWFQWSPLFDRSMLFQQGEMCRQFIHPSARRMIRIYMQLQMFTSSGSQLNYTCTRHQWKVAWFSSHTILFCTPGRIFPWGSHQCQWRWRVLSECSAAVMVEYSADAYKSRKPCSEAMKFTRTSTAATAVQSCATVTLRIAAILYGILQFEWQIAWSLQLGDSAFVEDELPWNITVHILHLGNCCVAYYLVMAEDFYSSWRSLLLPWNPGGRTRYWLEGKPNFMGEGMSWE